MLMNHLLFDPIILVGIISIEKKMEGKRKITVGTLSREKMERENNSHALVRLEVVRRVMPRSNPRLP
jgi:hypothetical protein